MGANIFGYLNQCLGASVRCCLLISLSIKNSELIYALYKKKDGPISYWHVLATLMTPVNQYKKLFDPELSDYGLNEDVESKRYKRIYKKICALPKPVVCELTSPNVRGLQAVFIQRSFRELLDIKVPLVQAQSLSHGGGVSLIIKDFLESCGCPHVPVSRNDLRCKLSAFANGSKDVVKANHPISPLIRIDDLEDGGLSIRAPQFKKGILKVYFYFNDFVLKKAMDKEVYTCKSQQINKMILKVKELRDQQSMSIFGRIAWEIYFLGFCFIIMKDSEGEHLDEKILENARLKLSNHHQKFVSKNLTGKGARAIN